MLFAGFALPLGELSKQGPGLGTITREGKEL